MFCKYCGNQLKDDAFVCMQCGCETGLHQRALSHAHADKPSVFDAFLYFFFWIFGSSPYFSPEAVCPFSVPVKDLTVPVRRAGFCPYLRYNISFPRSTAYFTV